MNESVNEATEATPDTETGTETPHDTEAVEPTPEGEAEPQTFDLSYVQELRSEAAAHRVKAKRTDEANEVLVRTIAQMDGRLHDPQDVGLSDDMLDDRGIVSPEKVQESIAALIEAKPHLAKQTPRTPLPMGVQANVEQPPSLLQMVRERM